MHGHLADGLGGVRVQDDAPFAANRGNFADRLMVPISLFASITETNTVSGLMASAI